MLTHNHISLRLRRAAVRLSAVLLAIWTLGAPIRAQEPAAAAPLTTAEAVKSLPTRDFGVPRPLDLTGLVTLVDRSNDLFVVQDATGALAIHPCPADPFLRPGRRVRLRASACSPYVFGCPDFPYAPQASQILPDIDMLDFRAQYRLTRFRGWINPPVSGAYTFWIASDNSSELWLASNDDPAEARQIASVHAGEWTNPREWDRYASQQSDPVRLQAGKRYYIEVLQEQETGPSHVSVAWKGPGLTRTVIGPQNLTPWPTTSSGGATAATAGIPRGILRESFDGFTAARLASLSAVNVAEDGIATRDLEIDDLGPGEWPDPARLSRSPTLDPANLFRWIEGEGTLSFFARDGRDATLEVAFGQQRLQLHVDDWDGPPPDLDRQVRVRFRGVCVGGRNQQGQLVASRILVASNDAVWTTASLPAGAEVPPAASPLAPGPMLSGYYYTRGVVTFAGDVGDQQMVYVQERTGGVFVAMDTFPIHVPLRVGEGVEIGGGLLPGKVAPGIIPIAVNVVGWHDLPRPVELPADRSAPGLRDGLWMQTEGVVRRVNPDGSLKLMGRREPMTIWVGQTTPAEREQLINRRVTVRGVYSLEAHEAPILLIPSLRFVEQAGEGPAATPEVRPIAEVAEPAGPTRGEGWVHRVAIAGRVTYRDPQQLYVQDATGAIRVEATATTRTRLGAAVRVLGFPEPGDGEPILADAVCLADGAAPPAAIAPAALDLAGLAPGDEGRLVELEGQLLSQSVKNATQILDIRSGDRIFEAVLGRPEARILRLVPGSTLRLTGIAILKRDASAGPSGAAGRLELARLLLRGSGDVRLVQGPPWWTWRQTASLLPILLLILAGTLLRIVYLHRRFDQQQAARRAFAREIMANQESERRRIAASLHDSLGQALLVIRNQTSRVLHAAPPEDAALRRRLEEISGATLQAIEEVREITHNLRPYQLDRLGLTQAIRALTRKVAETSQIEFACLVDDIDGLFDKEAEMHLYRIIQEGINNILKHSGATEASVVVRRHASRLTISIRDNGRGLPAAAPAAEGIGLGSIHERARILLGTARIESQPEGGLNLTVEMPLPDPPAQGAA